MILKFRPDLSAFKRFTALGLALPALLALAEAASAADLIMDQNPAAGWVVTLGGMTAFSNSYAGSRALTPGFMPSLSWSRPGETPSFSAPEDGVDFAAFESRQFKIGATFGFEAGRYRTDSARLAGLNSVPWTINSGLFAEVWPISDRFRLRAELEHGFRKTDGFTANVSADWVENFGALTLSGGPRISLADRTQMRSRFGITAAESLTSGYAAYAPRGGVKSVGVGMAQSYKLSPSWTGTLYEHYDRLTGPAAKSPLVLQGGSKNQLTIGVGMNYTFKAW